MGATLPVPPMTSSGIIAMSTPAMVSPWSSRIADPPALRARPGDMTAPASGSTRAAEPRLCLAPAIGRLQTTAIIHRLRHHLRLPAAATSLLAPPTTEGATSATPIPPAVFGLSTSAVVPHASRAKPGDLTKRGYGSIAAAGLILHWAGKPRHYARYRPAN